MNEALNKILSIRSRCKKQKTISTHLIVDDLLIIEKTMQSAYKTFKKLNQRMQKAETDNKRLRAKVAELEHELNKC